MADHEENVREARKRADWESRNRRSNVSSDADVARGERYVQDAGFMQDARDTARKVAQREMKRTSKRKSRRE